MRKLKDKIKRFRNSRGFGVHSPFGYSITQRVTNLGSDYAYYAEREIRKLGKSQRESTEAVRHAIMLHRLAAMFPPGTKFLTNRKPSKLQRLAIERAGCILKSGERRAESGEDSAYAPSRGLDKGCSIYIQYTEEPEKEALETLNQLRSGIIFEGIRCVIAIPRPQTQPVIYKLNF